MSERIVSPGVYMNENDLSYLPPAINEASGMIIGPFLKGPAFYPTELTSRNEAIVKFGDTYDKFFTPYAVQEYLKNAGSVYVVRVLWEEGYQADCISIESTAKGAVCILAPTSADDGGLSITWPETSTASEDMRFTLSSSVGEVAYTASLHSADSNYIKDLFGTSAWGDKGVYVYAIFDTAIGTTYMTDITGSAITNGIDFNEQVYKEATTPLIISQKVNGSSTNLFKFHSLSDGDTTNDEIKIGIFDVKPASDIAGSDFGTFGVVVRKIDDTDDSPKVLETFTECNLDPDSTSYIARKIGNRYGTYSSVGGDTKLRMIGDYEPKSNYIRVEVENTVDIGGVAKNLVPFGFAAPYVPFTASANPPAMYYITSSLENGSVNTKIYKGVDLHSDYEDDNKQFLKSIPDNNWIGSNIDFHLEDTTSGSVSCSLSSALSYKQFTIPMQGGFDGKNPANKLTTDSTTLMGFDMSSATALGSVSYKKAFDTVSNKDEIVMNLLSAPGVNLVRDSSLYTYAKNICEDRGDTFFVIDCGSSDQSVASAVSQTTTLDSSYAATYYPWVKIQDTNTNRYVWVPPSVVIPGVIAFNDKVGYEWYAPAGLNRGGLTSVIEAKTRLTHTERDDLYTARINPIASFPNVGTVVWGQKTLQALPSATDRINVRRLLIKLKDYVGYVSKQLNFQNNTNSERQKWVNTITPYMESVQQKNGLYAFKVVMDDTNNTPDDIDRNIMRGEIWVQPSRVAEFIIIDFNITRTGATFGV